jgi:hypothetical protein
MKISIDPVIGQWIGIGIAVCGAVALMSPTVFPSYIPAGTVKDIIQTAGFVGSLGGIVTGALGRYSSSAPGPGAPQDPPQVVQAQLVAQKAELDKQIAAVPVK